MIVYEKNNKLNINFDNEISENPDLQISKSGDKTEVLIDGQPSSGGGGGNDTLVVNVLTYDILSLECTVDKTVQEVVDAAYNHQNIICIVDFIALGVSDSIAYLPLKSVQILDDGYGITFLAFDGVYIISVSARKVDGQYIWEYEEYPLNG